MTAPVGTWLNPRWNRRRPLTVTAVDSIATGYTARLHVINEEAKAIYDECLSTGADLRVAYWNGAFWEDQDRRLDTFSSSEIDLWWKLHAAVTSGQSDTDHYLYYDNPRASAAPVDYTNVYELYDPFSTYDTTLWTTLSGSVSTTGDGVVHLKEAAMETLATFGPGEVVKYRAKLGSNTLGAVFMGFVEGKWTDYCIFGIGGLQIRRTSSRVDNGTIENSNETSLDWTSYQEFEIRWTTTSLKFYLNDVLKQTHTTIHDGPSTIYFGAIALGAAVELYLDWVWARKYVVNEPTVSLGAEATSNYFRIAH